MAAQGFHEVYNYSFLSEETVRQFGGDPEEHVKVLNPIAADQGLMRKSLVPGIWKNIIDNSRFSDEFRLFEVGREIHKQAGDLPHEVNHLCAAMYRKESRRRRAVRAEAVGGVCRARMRGAAGCGSAVRASRADCGDRVSRGDGRTAVRVSSVDGEGPGQCAGSGYRRAHAPDSA